MTAFLNNSGFLKDSLNRTIFEKYALFEMEDYFLRNKPIIDSYMNQYYSYVKGLLFLKKAFSKNKIFVKKYDYF